MFITVNQNLIDKQSNNQNNNGEPRKVWLKLNDGEQVFIQSMLDTDAFIGYYRHTVQVNGKWEYIHCTDPSTCPCCQRKMARKLRTLVPMVVADDVKGTNPRIMVFDASVNDVKEFYLAKNECEEEGSDFLQTVFKFKRIGQKLDTTYRMTATRGNVEVFKGGLELKMPQWDKLIKFPTPQEVEAILGGVHGVSTQNTNAQAQNKQNTPIQHGAVPSEFMNNNPETDPFGGFSFTPEDDEDMPF